jgi:hypothetical protein
VEAGGGTGVVIASWHATRRSWAMQRCRAGSRPTRAGRSRAG